MSANSITWKACGGTPSPCANLKEAAMAMSLTPTLLLILDGYGLAPAGPGNAAGLAHTPTLDRILANPGRTSLAASGRSVGLPEGFIGNSEVGHLNIGAGRVVYQDMTRIDMEIESGALFQNPVLLELLRKARDAGGRIHYLGLLSDGGVHSHINHLEALLKLAKQQRVPALVQAFLDGRDTSPRSGAGYVRRLESIAQEQNARIATLCGRYYAMDRDKRWERVKESYDLMVNGIGKPSTDMVQAIADSYAEGVTDEFIKPIVHVDANGKPLGKIEEGDVVIFFNYRNDRAKELTIVLTQKDMPEEGMKTIPNLQYFTMTPYDSSFTGIYILFDKDNVQDTLGEIVSKAGKKQLRIAETEKFAHVTFFFSGGRESEFDLEERILIASPKVATYDLQPEMSAYEVADALTKELDKKKFDFVALNFANGDMVGHTGIYEAIEKAVVTIDNCVEKVVESAKANGYDIIIIADHGNADNAVNADGTPNTAHSLNPVPFVYISDNKNAKVEDGILADVAPSVCALLGIPQPKDMTGKNLIKN